jgi:transposase
VRRHELREVGEEVSEQLDFVPAQLRVRRTVRKTCACRGCNTLTTAATPSVPVERGRFTERFLAWLAWSKYGLHLPLERLLGELRRMGVELQVSTLCDQIKAISDLVEPIVRRLKAQLIASRHVRTDGTGLLVLQRGGGKARLGQMAIYCSPTIALYHYTPTKEGKHARDFLHGYAGHLVADAASTFDQLYTDGRILEVGCWAHAKRKFDDATDSEPRAANEALAFVSELYDVEHRARDRGIEGSLDHRALRLAESVPILDRFKTWLDLHASASLPKSPLGQAARYCVRHWTALTRFVDDAALPLDNNLSERLLRAVAVGRDNYVFAGSDAGAARAANLYSVIQTCKLVGVDPLAWLSDVLERVTTWPINRLDELLPARWTNQTAQKPPAN